MHAACAAHSNYPRLFSLTPAIDSVMIKLLSVPGERAYHPAILTFSLVIKKRFLPMWGTFMQQYLAHLINSVCSLHLTEVRYAERCEVTLVAHHITYMTHAYMCIGSCACPYQIPRTIASYHIYDHNINLMINISSLTTSTCEQRKFTKSTAWREKESSTLIPVPMQGT